MATATVPSRFTYNEQIGVRREFYAPAEIAEMFGVSHAHVLNMVKRGDLAGCRFGKRYLIPVAEIERIRQSARGAEI